MGSGITPTTFPGGPGGPWAPLKDRVKNVNPMTTIKLRKHKYKAEQQTWFPFSPLGPAGPELPCHQNQKKITQSDQTISVIKVHLEIIVSHVTPRLSWVSCVAFLSRSPRLTRQPLLSIKRFRSTLKQI